ncbi:type IV pilus modification protein PilV [Alkalilimnicola ehrlichii MLHE-1]|uniref:Type IV pilus modification protein PilV n=1 Tax=Alkalilimnicola ehrlichii (strain ATCC BAA-1101 / DSM 17681 / MLHE-1) TaxID=187272 RepID=Q0AAC5_ALKEH|nr:type IV pilus modification protein PilV [Alkalilimnicola ehrlichii]ABI56212.1 type IV pilus modification protein PilV [Alkalilimnicola ehrlichii MLHE-1]
MRSAIHSTTGPRRQGGFTLLEVLIALVIISVGLLGVLALQANMLSYSHSAYLSSMASVQALDLEERMRANRGAVVDGDYDFSDFAQISTANPDACEGGLACNEAQLAANDLARWARATRGLFPGTLEAELSHEGANTDDLLYRLTLEWTERGRGGDPDDDRIDFDYWFRL